METSVANLVKNDLSNLDEVLADYDACMRGYTKNLKVDMKTFAKASSEQAGWLAHYSEIHDELVVIFKDMETRVKVAKAAVFTKLGKNSSQRFTEKELTRKEDEDTTVNLTIKALREIEERKAKAETIVGAFTARGYTLNNMTRIRAGGFHDEYMYVKDDE